MAGPTVKDLIDLAVGENDSANAHVTQLFSWRHDLFMMVARSLAGTGAALALGLTLAVVQGDADTSRWFLIAGFGGAVLTIVVGGIVGWRARNLQRQFVAAQFLLAELQTIRPFLRRYMFRGSGR